MKLHCILAAVVLIAAVNFTSAAENVTTMISGADCGRSLTKVEFGAGDEIILHFSDNSTETVNMESVEIYFGQSAGSGLDCITADPKLPAGIYNLKGQRVAEKRGGLLPGVYVIDGEKILVK